MAKGVATLGLLPQESGPQVWMVECHDIELVPLAGVGGEGFPDSSRIHSKKDRNLPLRTQLEQDPGGVGVRLDQLGLGTDED